MKHTALYFFCALFIAFAIGCKKEDSNIGADLVPDGDKLNVFTYEVPLPYKTIEEDSLKTNALGAILVGSMNDPIFGRTTASLGTQFKLETAIDFGANPRIDSVVLTMAYLPAANIPYYGDAGKLGGVQRFKVYELNETLSADSSYYSDHTPQFTSLLGQKLTIPNTVDTVKYNRGSTVISEVPQLRISLDTTRFSQLLDNGAYTSSDAFSAAFKGLYLTTDNSSFQGQNQGAILRFNGVTDRACRIRIFYRNDSSSVGDNQPYEYADLVMMNGVPRYQVYTHAYAPTEVQSNINLGTAAQRTYVQGLAGVKTKIILPDFDTIADFQGGNYIVNLAELVVPIDESTLSPTFGNISQLLAVAPSSDSIYNNLENPPSVIIADGNLPGDFYGGSYDKTNKEYVIRISLHVTDILNGIIPNKGLYLVVSGASTVPQRIAIPNTVAEKIKLRLIYTKI